MLTNRILSRVPKLVQQTLCRQSHHDPGGVPGKVSSAHLATECNQFVLRNIFLLAEYPNSPHQPLRLDCHFCSLFRLWIWNTIHHGQTSPHKGQLN